MSESTSPNGGSSRTTRKAKSAAKGSQPPPKAPDAGTPVAQINSLHLSTIDRRTMVEMAAYYRAERRRFASGHELEDWLGAEAEIEALLCARLESTGREAATA